MCRTDMFIIDRMMERNLSEYLREQDECRQQEEEAYEECMQAIEAETIRFANFIKKTAKQYGFDAYRLVEDEVIHSLESEVLQ